MRRCLLGLLVVLVAWGGSFQVASGSTKVVKAPKGLKFYKPPKHLPKQHGTLIWARKATGLVPLAGARYTKLVLYSSRSPQGKRVAVSGSVAVPRGKPPKRGWPVITWGHWTTGVADICAPSRDFQGSPANFEGTFAVPGEAYINPELNTWLRAGYAVLRTDYPGLGTPGKHPYLIGKSEGRSLLDIVKAARKLDPRIGKRFMTAGHSQGGQAALFAAGEAKGWVPHLRLRGTVAFAPPSHILEGTSLTRFLTSPSPFTAVATMINYGAVTQSSQINVNLLLSDQVLAFYPLLEQQCLSRLAQSDELGGIAPSNVKRPGADTSVRDPIFAAMNPLVSSAAPIMIAQGDSDTFARPSFTQMLGDELNAAGNQLTYKTYPGVDHVGVVSAAEPDALSFFEQLLPPRR